MVSEQTFEALLDGYTACKRTSIERGKRIQELEAERDEAQEMCRVIAGNAERIQGHLVDAVTYSTLKHAALVQAAEEARTGHSARLFGMLDAMKGEAE